MIPATILEQFQPGFLGVYCAPHVLAMLSLCLPHSPHVCHVPAYLPHSACLSHSPCICRDPQVFAILPGFLTCSLVVYCTPKVFACAIPLSLDICYAPCVLNVAPGCLLHSPSVCHTSQVLTTLPGCLAHSQVFAMLTRCLPHSPDSCYASGKFVKFSWCLKYFNGV